MVRWLWLLVGCGAAPLERGPDPGDCLWSDCAAVSSDAPDACRVLAKKAQCGPDAKCGIAWPDHANDGWEPECLDLLGDLPEGALCTLYATGQDACGPGLWCWGSRCRAYCDPLGDDCGDGACIALFDGLGVCEAACDPTMPTSCAPAHNCSRYDGAWTCLPSPTFPEPGASCTVDWECPADWSCAVPAAGGPRTCLQRCDVPSGEGCAVGEACRPEGDPAFPTLGLCEPQ